MADLEAVIREMHAADDGAQGFVIGAERDPYTGKLNVDTHILNVITREADGRKTVDFVDGQDNDWGHLERFRGGELYFLRVYPRSATSSRCPQCDPDNESAPAEPGPAPTAATPAGPPPPGRGPIPHQEPFPASPVVVEQKR
jgi:hypothetical protein